MTASMGSAWSEREVGGCEKERGAPGWDEVKGV